MQNLPFHIVDDRFITQQKRYAWIKTLWQEISRLTSIKYTIEKHYATQRFYYMTHGGEKKTRDKFTIARALKTNIEKANTDEEHIYDFYFKMAQNFFLGMLRVHDDQFRRELRNAYHQVTDENEHFGLREEYMNYLKDEIVNIWNNVSQNRIKEERQKSVYIMSQPRRYLRKIWSENDIIERLWANFIPLLIMETSINYYSYIESNQLDKKIKELDLYQEYIPKEILSIIANYLFKDLDKLSNYEKITQCFKALAKYFISHPKPSSINSLYDLQQNVNESDAINDNRPNLSLHTTSQIVNGIMQNPKNPDISSIPLAQNKPSMRDLKRKMSLMAIEMNAIINICKDGLKIQGHTRKYSPQGINDILKLLEPSTCSEKQPNNCLVPQHHQCLCALEEKNIIQTFEELFQILKACNDRYQETPNNEKPPHVTSCYMRFFQYVQPLHEQFLSLQQQSSKMNSDNGDIDNSSDMNDNWQLRPDNWFYPY